eukprot:TRINITY_DN1944_c0_g1_i1.p1 TRINITY_DN1944_c0_g1~~TRINITY_DN1944_c0_g1_i1.p1  ORF type:complete len:613 (-),score=165.55 TRINITY_DN1944_c0_g1_i1:360-2198(-)
MDLKTFFIKRNEETFKVSNVQVTSFSGLQNIFKEKFGGDVDDNNSFYIPDHQFNVPHKLEKVSEIYDGAVIEIRRPEAKDDATKLKKELEETKRKLAEIEQAKNSDSKEPRRPRSRSRSPERKEPKEGEKKEREREREIEGSSASDRDHRSEVQSTFASSSSLSSSPSSSVSASSTSSVITSSDSSLVTSVSVSASSASASSSSSLSSSSSSASSSASPEYIVRLRGLPWQASTTEVVNFFKGLNIIEDKVCFVLNQQGRPTGESFVSFRDEKSQAEALLRHKQYMGSRFVEVFASTSAERTKALDRAKPWQPISSTSRFVRMRGLPFSSAEDDVKNWLGADIVGVHLVYDSSGRVTGEAFVEVATEDLESKILAKHKQTMGSRYIELFASSVREAENLILGYSRSYSHSRFGSDPRRDDRDHFSRGGGGSSRRDDDYHASRDKRGVSVYDSLSSYERASNDEPFCVHMKGLPYSSTDEDIHRFFLQGGCDPIRIHRRPQGGDAYLEFATASDLKLAMARHKANMGRRYIELFRVSYAEMAEVVRLPRTYVPPSTTTPNFSLPTSATTPLATNFYLPTAAATNAAASLLQLDPSVATALLQAYPSLYQQPPT